MIRFSCRKCDKSLRANDSEGGRKFQCSKCGTVDRIPKNSVSKPSAQAKIDFECASCDKKYSVELKHAGRKIKCGKCHNINRVPSTTKEESDSNLKSETPPEKLILAELIEPTTGIVEAEVVEDLGRITPSRSRGLSPLAIAGLVCLAVMVIVGSTAISAQRKAKRKEVDEKIAEFRGKLAESKVALKRARRGLEALKSMAGGHETSRGLSGQERSRLQRKVNSLSDDDAVEVFVQVYNRAAGSQKQELYDGVVSRASGGNQFYKSVLSRISRP